MGLWEGLDYIGLKRGAWESKSKRGLWNRSLRGCCVVLCWECSDVRYGGGVMCGKICMCGGVGFLINY